MQPDIVLICESWCNSSISDANISISGYELQQDLRFDRSDTANGIGGGLVVYSRNGLEILSCDKISDFNQYCKFKLKCDGETYAERQGRESEERGLSGRGGEGGGSGSGGEEERRGGRRGSSRLCKTAIWSSSSASQPIQKVIVWTS